MGDTQSTESSTKQYDSNGKVQSTTETKTKVETNHTGSYIADAAKTLGGASIGYYAAKNNSSSNNKNSKS
jgi:hypothetical protein